MTRLARAFCVLVLFVAAVAAAAQPAQKIIHEGVGWERFSVGTDANTLIDVFGFPDKHSQGRMMRWDKAGLNCLLNDRNEAIELRFEKPSKAVTAGGVTFGMSADQVRKIYGNAGRLDWRGGGMKLIWPSHGILIWFHDNKVYQIVIFKPQSQPAAS